MKMDIGLVQTLDDLLVPLADLVAHLAGEAHGKPAHRRIWILILVQLLHQFEHEAFVEVKVPLTIILLNAKVSVMHHICVTKVSWPA